MKIGYDAKRIFHNTTGLGNYGRDIVRILNAYPVIQHFFLFNTKPSKLRKKIPLDKATIVYPKGLFWRSFPSLWRIFGQWKQIDQSELDWYHGLSGEIPVRFRNKKVKKIVTIHDLIFLTHPGYYNPFDRIIYKLKFQYAVKVADHIIAISEQTKADIIKYLKVNKGKITVIYQGCHETFKRSYSASKKEEVRNKFGLPEDYVLNVGTLQERKNALALIKAVHTTNHHLVLIGKEKKYAKKLRKFILQNNMEDQVSFLKDVNSEELAIIYQNATVFCYPSFCEGFGIPLIEALYSKLPVVVTKHGCFPEAAGPNSIYIDPFDIVEIRTVLNKLFDDPKQRLEIAERGFEYVQQFSDENVAKNLLNLYKTMG